MPNYRINHMAVKHARELIDDGKVDVDTEWSDAAPSTADGNAEIEKHGWTGYAAWHLALDQDANDETKPRRVDGTADPSRAAERACVAPGLGGRLLDDDVVARAHALVGRRARFAAALGGELLGDALANVFVRRQAARRALAQPYEMQSEIGAERPRPIARRQL